MSEVMENALWAVARRASGALTRHVRDHIDGISMGQAWTVLRKLEREGLIERNPHVFWKKKVLWNATSSGLDRALKRRALERHT